MSLLRVLLIDPGPERAATLRDALAAGGHTPAVTRAASPPELAAALDASRWDVVISPLDGGVPIAITLAALRRRGLDTPLILVADQSDEPRAIGAMREGAADLVEWDRLARLAPAVRRELRVAEARAEHQRSSREARRQAARAQALLRAAARLNAQIELGAVIRTVCEETSLALGDGAAAVWLYNSGRDAFIAADIVGPGAASVARLAPLPYARFVQLRAAAGPGAGLLNLTEVGALARAGVSPPAGDTVGVELRRGGELVGLLTLDRPGAAQSLGADELGLLCGLADLAATAIVNARLMADLQRANEALTAAYDATLEGWVHGLDLRDRETEGHTRRVTEMTVRLAQALGVPERDLGQIRRGALLHDIGKIGIPDAILLKPGPLTDEEWAIMRRHPVYAYEWLAPIGYLRPALDIPYCHHERWDGTGYPRGLKAEKIPLAARIFSVVDAWDAMRSVRPYKSAQPEAAVREQLRSQAGRQFDPRVVAAFLALLSRLDGGVMALAGD